MKFSFQKSSLSIHFTVVFFNIKGTRTSPLFRKHMFASCTKHKMIAYNYMMFLMSGNKKSDTLTKKNTRIKQKSKRTRKNSIMSQNNQPKPETRRWNTSLYQLCLDDIISTLNCIFKGDYKDAAVTKAYESLLLLTPLQPDNVEHKLFSDEVKLRAQRDYGYTYGSEVWLKNQ